MNPRALVALAAVAALGAAACGSSSTSTSPGTGSGKPGPALVEEANTGVTFTQNFNPFDSSSTAKAMNMTSLVYEPLFEFDALNPAEIHPWLGTKYSFDSTGQNLTVTIRSGVKWNDGSALTANDVAFTFSLIMNNSAANDNGVPT